ncbi:MAG: glycosyltransferase [Symploca sp. SIO2D2]|nr:glycosyltransferase [Symploca sp. SIO2D2]
MRVDVSAYLLCYNNAQTILSAIDSVVRQSIDVQRIIVIDDGSDDGSRKAIKTTKAELFETGSNQGRGYARALAMEQLESELVLCCDATIDLAPDFLEKALQELESDDDAAAVFGNLHQRESANTADRWRERHLFAPARVNETRRVHSFHTTAALVRRSEFMEAGNYDKNLRHSEDAEIAKRVVKRGKHFLASPLCRMYANLSNPALKVLERHWRWYAGENEHYDAKTYAKRIGYSFKVMARKDLKDGDWRSIILSLFSPHYQLYKALKGRENATA